MPDCKENIEKISAYVDGELPSSEIETLEKHISECAHCTTVLKATREEKKLMQQTFTSMRAPVYLSQRIMTAIREEARRETAKERMPFFRRLLAPSPAWALASLVLVLLAGTIYMRTQGIISPGGDKPTTMGLYLNDISHDQYLVNGLPERPLDIACDDPHKAETFMSKFVGFEVHVPTLKAEGYGVKGARLWHTVARISALIVYEDEKGRSISLFEIKKDRIGKKEAKTVVTSDGRTFYVGGAYGYNGVTWVQKNVALGLVGDLPPGELLKLAKSAAASLQD
jgi:mycothiol system anti-sigma-R factor